MNMIPIPNGMNTRIFVMDRGALRHVPQVLKEYFPGKIPQIIADGNTWRAAGEKVYAYLKDAGLNQAEPVLYPAEPRLHPDNALSEKLSVVMNSGICPVAVGSGVINDIVKVASGYAKIPFLCVPTACSVDGYTSAGGAMTVGGRKVTVPCPAPFGVVADPDVLETAPPEMLASGYADLLTKMPAGADWIIADILGLEPVNGPVWSIVQDELRSRVADSHDLGRIFAGLAATGYSMQLYHDSRPASGAEHMFSHILEMEKLMFNGEEVSHGFKVGVGTVAVMHLMEFVLNTPVETARAMAKPLQTAEQRRNDIRELLKQGCYGTGIEETAMNKFQDGRSGILRRELIWSKWEEIRSRIRGQLYSLETIRQMLCDAGAPVTASGIGCGRNQFLHAVRTSQLIRKRYVVTDLLYEAGLFDHAMATLEDMI